MTVAVTLDMLGGNYSFRSKNPNDTVVYQGTIIDFAVLSSVGKYGNGNVAAYHQAVRQADPTVTPDVSNIKVFLVIKLTNSNGINTEYVMAPDWIVDASFTKLDTTATVSVWVLDDENSDHSGIIEALRAAGYLNCGITSVS